MCRSARLRGRQRPARHGQHERRLVPVAGDAQQRLHHAPGRLDAIRQRLVEPVPVVEGRQGRQRGRRAGRGLRRHLGRHRRSAGRLLLPPHPPVRGRHLLGNRRIPAHSRLGKRSTRHERVGRVLGGRQRHSRHRDRPRRTRQGPDGPRRRYDRIEPLHDLHGKVVLLGSDRTESELRHRPLGQQQLPRSSA